MPGPITRMWTLDTVRQRCRIEPSEDGCWTWLGGVTVSNGTPQARISGKSGEVVGRWVLKYLGHKIDGKLVTASCENPRCLNPNHLKIISYRELNLKVYAEGKKKPALEYAKKLQSAKDRGMAKLNDAKVEEIRVLVDENWTSRQIAEKYGVHKDTINRIRQGKSWRQQLRGASVFNWRPAQ